MQLAQRKSLTFIITNVWERANSRREAIKEEDRLMEQACHNSE
jgi:hypothetical protein